MEEKSSSSFAPAEASFYWSAVVAVLILCLFNTVWQNCSHPAVLRVGLVSDEISTGPSQREEQENSDPYEPRHLKLQFSNNMINGPIYTGQPIGDEDLGNTLYLDLVDCRTGNIVTYGAEASVEVELFAVEKEEFKIATSWDGKSLIGRDSSVSLKDGRVCASHISFKHTEVHMRKRELRLGARVVDSCNNGNTIIEPAVTEPFLVVDRRSIRKKLKPLHLDDPVWNLPNIGKGGPYHEVLNKESINTTRDFLTRYFLNREYLLKIPSKSMSAKKLDETVNWAKSKLHLERHVYPRENPLVRFTNLGELIGVKLYEEGQFVPVEQLTQTQKAFGMKLVKRAFSDGHLKVLLNDDSSQMICSSSSSCNASDHLDGSNNGFTSEANNFPTDPQQLQPQPHNDASYTQTTSLGVVNNNDYMSQINSSSTTLTGALPRPDEDDFINQLPDDDSSQMLCSNNGFTSKAYNFPTDTQQLQSQPHNDDNHMQSTSLIVNNNDYRSQINSSSTTLTGGDINQLLNESWEYIYLKNQDFKI